MKLVFLPKSLVSNAITQKKTWIKIKFSHKITSKIILNFLIAFASTQEFLHIFSAKEDIMLSVTKQIIFVKT